MMYPDDLEALVAVMAIEMEDLKARVEKLENESKILKTTEIEVRNVIHRTN
jgi:hypothetical protein